MFQESQDDGKPDQPMCPVALKHLWLDGSGYRRSELAFVSFFEEQSRDDDLFCNQLKASEVPVDYFGWQDAGMKNQGLVLCCCERDKK